MTTSSLIIATYNRPDALELVLRSVLMQSVLPSEIIIADDGSDERTAKLVKDFIPRFTIPLLHIWQPDEGFRLSAIRNKAIAAASGLYMIQVDGDVVLHPKFVEDHVRFAREGSFVRASRIYLNEAFTQKLIGNQNPSVTVWHKGVSNKTSALHLPLLWPIFEYGYKNKGDERYEIHGCNMAFWRSDAIAVNGYNEDFEGWGYEDKEFVVRLLAYGLNKRFLKLGGIVYHLYHPINTKEREAENAILLKKAIEQPVPKCKNGLNKYLLSND